ncbi:hypothetical protein HZF08_25195 [Paenibacillus sp. CGMCC 1.16610]|uniref:Uncharacterized protein n=1 Tax=Paenibacillus anseongense TaxID=2682845 RepID=A0ABW9UMI1_9BACL|nr:MULTISPECIES: hypothetical protein [Paenibacillus]MBA2941587.1 hypothetical protein [Paenibacillus sp. CGMCC 1.16610]MVQ40400.1 hypothetical protein [Paenibacillus anseongense]
MSISTTDQTVNKCAAAISQLSLSVFQLIEAILHRIESQVDEDKTVLSFQICVLLTSLLDVHTAHQRKNKSHSWIEKNDRQLFSSPEVREKIAELYTLLQQTDLVSNSECMERLDEFKDYYQSDPIQPEAERTEIETHAVVSEQFQIESIQHVEVITSSQTQMSASPPPLMFTQRERKTSSKRR